MFPAGRSETLGDLLDAIVYYGDVSDVVVRADLRELQASYGAELERRHKLMDEARKILVRQ